MMLNKRSMVGEHVVLEEHHGSKRRHMPLDDINTRTP